MTPLVLWRGSEASIAAAVYLSCDIDRAASRL
jgi:hypothetical protein